MRRKNVLCVTTLCFFCFARIVLLGLFQSPRQKAKRFEKGGTKVKPRGELSIPHSGIPAVLIVYVNHVNRDFKAMFIQHQKTFAPPRNSCWIRLLFTHKNDCGGAISVTEQRSCAAPISKVGRHISDRV